MDAKTTETYMVTALLVTLPTLYSLIRRKSDQNKPRARLRTPLTLLVLVHTLYILHRLLLDPPPNLFTRHRIPLTLSVDGIRAILLARAGETYAMSPATDALLRRLASFDMRTIFVRFGQRLVEECTHCRTQDEYALHAAPRPLLEYVREAAVMGLVTIRGSHRTRWRTTAVAIIAVAAIAETYWLLTVPIEIPASGVDVFWWHDLCWYARHTLFLLLPILVHLLPGVPPSSPARPIAQLPLITAALGAALSRAHLLKLSTAAVARDPLLAGRTQRWWDRERAEGTAIRDDTGVRRAADREGLGFGEGSELATRADEFARKLTDAYQHVPS